MGVIWGKVVREGVSGKVTSKQKEVRGIWRKSCPNRGNCKCKGPKGECAIYSDGEGFVGSRYFLFRTHCIEAPSGHPGMVTKKQERFG